MDPLAHAAPFPILTDGAGILPEAWQLKNQETIVGD